MQIKHNYCGSESSIGLEVFGSGRARAGNLKNCRTSIGPNVGVKSRFSANNFRDRWNEAKRAPCINVAVCNWCDCA